MRGRVWWRWWLCVMWMGVERRRFVVSGRDVVDGGARGELLEEVEGALFRERERCVRVARVSSVTRGPVTLVPPLGGG